MTKEELEAVLAKLPARTEIYVRAGSHRDDAYPATFHVFESKGVLETIGFYIDVDSERTDEHRNYPEGYSGCKEVTRRFRKA